MIRAFAQDTIWTLDKDTMLFVNREKTRVYDMMNLGKSAHYTRNSELIDRNEVPIYEEDYVIVGENYAPALVIFEKGEFKVLWGSRQNLTWSINDARIEFLEVVGNTLDGLKKGYNLC